MRWRNRTGSDVVAVIGIDHVQLAMPRGSEDMARAFYSGILGLVEEQKPTDLAKRGGCWFVGGEAHIHLGVEDDFAPALKAHPALLVDGLAALIDRLALHGIEARNGQPLAGYVRCDISDPFGNRIELMQRV